MTMNGGNEGQRQAYLAALGLPLWTARFDLPGAAPSQSLVAVPFVADLPEAISAGQASVPLPAEPEAPAAPAPIVTAFQPGSPSAPVTPAVPAEPSATETVSQATPRFALRMQPLAPGWMGIIVLGEVPDLSAQEYRLLAAIGHVLGAEPDFGGGASLLRWPLNSNPRLDHGASAAVEWLSHALKVPEGWRCLVLGEAVAVHVRAALPPGISMVVGPALTTLLKSPLAKKPLWLSLHA